MRSNSVFSLVDEGDVLVTTVGPFSKWGEPAVRAAITARAAYIDSTGEPAFIRRIFENHGPIAAQAGVPLLTAMGYDFVPGALAAALALEDAGEDAVRVDVGYFALGMSTQSGSGGTRASLVGASLDDSHAFRDGKLKIVRTAERVRTSRSRTRSARACPSAAPSTSGCPPATPACRRSTSTWAGSARSRGRCRPARWSARSPPGCPACARRSSSRARSSSRSPRAPRPARHPDGESRVAAQAYDAAGEPLAEVELAGGNWYAFTADFIAWAARAALAGRVKGTGALGPVEAFGLAELERACAAAGLSRVPA